MSTSTGSSIAATQPLFTSAPRPTLNDRSSLASKSTTNTPVAARRHGVEREVDDSSSFASSTTSLPLPLPHVGSVLDDRASADSTPSTGTPVAPARRPRLVESVLDVGVYDEEAALSASAHYSDLDLINRQNFGNTTRDLQLLELARRERMGVPAEFHTFIPQNAASSATPVLEDESLLDRLLQRARLQGHSGDGEASVGERHEPQNSVALDNITNPLAMAQNIFMKHSPAISERRNLLDTTEAVAPDAALTEQPDDSSGDESVVNELVASLAGRALPIASSRAQPSPTVVMNLTTGTKKQPFRSNYGAEKREEDRAAIGDSATSSDDDIFTWNGRRRKDNLVVNASSTSTFRPVVARAPSDESLLRARQSLIDSLPAVVPAPTTSSRGTSTASAHGPSFTVIELPQDDVYNRPITPSVSQGSGFTVIEMPEGDNVDDDLDRHYRYRPLATSPTRDAGNESDGGDIDVASSSTANAASKRKKRPKKKKVKSIGMDTVIATTTPLAAIEHWRDLLREAPTPKHIRAKPFAPVTTLAHRWTTLRVTESALLRSPVVLLAFFRWLRDEVGLAAASAAFSSTIEPAVDACSPTLRLYPCAIWRDPVHRAFRVGVMVEAPPERFKSDRMLLRALKHRIKTIVLLDEHVLGEAVTLDELCTLCEDVGLDSSAWSIPLSCQGGVGINDERTFAVLVHAVGRGVCECFRYNVIAHILPQVDNCSGFQYRRKALPTVRRHRGYAHVVEQTIFVIGIALGASAHDGCTCADTTPVVCAGCLQCTRKRHIDYRKWSNFALSSISPP